MAACAASLSSASRVGNWCSDRHHYCVVFYTFHGSLPKKSVQLRGGSGPMEPSRQRLCIPAGNRQVSAIQPKVTCFFDNVY